MRQFIIAIAAVFTVSIATCGGCVLLVAITRTSSSTDSLDTFSIQRQRLVTKEEFGDKWPLKDYDRAWVCKDGFSLTAKLPDGREFALNGVALDAGYPDIAPVCIPTEFGHKNIGPLIDAASRLP